MSFQNKSLPFDLTNEGLNHFMQFYIYILKDMLKNVACIEVCSQEGEGFGNYVI